MRYLPEISRGLLSSGRIVLLLGCTVFCSSCFMLDLLGLEFIPFADRDAGAEPEDAEGRDRHSVDAHGQEELALGEDHFGGDDRIRLEENTPEACTDGFDNDGDGYTDCRDWDCDAVELCGVDEVTAATCSNGYDDDGNGDPDCEDAKCQGLSVCVSVEEGIAACSDGVDNDGDGAEDCTDAACLPLSICDPTEDRPATCSDGVDNDGDGQRDCRDTACEGLAVCSRIALRVATWNVHEIGAAGSAEFLAAVQVLLRIGADVVCLEEVHSDEGDRLSALGAAAGYTYVYQGAASTTMAAGLTNACLSHLPVASSRSLASSDLSSDPEAAEVARDFVELRVEIQPGVAFAGLLVAHLKSGFTHADFFRRGVEAIRLGRAVAGYRVAHAGEGIVVMGDFNEEVDSSGLGRIYETVPEDMPVSYHLGADIGLPLTYNPFAPLGDEGMALVVAAHEDLPSELGTRIPSARRIDYLFAVGLGLEGAEVYNDCQDNGVDDPPIGNCLSKDGAPLACGTVETASDHRPVFADFLLE